MDMRARQSRSVVVGIAGAANDGALAERSDGQRPSFARCSCPFGHSQRREKPSLAALAPLLAAYILVIMRRSMAMM